MDRPVDPIRARTLIRDRAERAGLPRDRTIDLEFAATEIITNALVHGGGTATMRMWERRGHLVCQVDDAGPGLDDPLAGYRPPGTPADGGGLWLSRQVVDLLQIVPGPGGTSARIHMRLPRP